MFRGNADVTELLCGRRTILAPLRACRPVLSGVSARADRSGRAKGWRDIAARHAGWPGAHTTRGRALGGIACSTTNRSPGRVADDRLGPDARHSGGLPAAVAGTVAGAVRARRPAGGAGGAARLGPRDPV
ncbi:hypothetical protein FRACA_230016 [Frankia canadensis]|uniref:Uncharacterized protein n=1 Tax=Frankia canadensis TaxID=1836972 RepID=A0A2I2KRD8_9ACTN|nr:hypothetical protein FRACA_230016 [Frankia canadensis]SOU55512.1 hypothetical protein FRACA_230016 [Frankia canadensis]